MHHTTAKYETTELTSEEILLEALASKDRVRANLISLIKLRSKSVQLVPELGHELQVEIEELLEIA